MFAIIDSFSRISGTFPKRLLHSFGQNFELFLYPFFLAKIGQEKVFGNVLDRKLVFLDFQYID